MSNCDQNLLLSKKHFIYTLFQWQGCDHAVQVNELIADYLDCSPEFKTGLNEKMEADSIRLQIQLMKATLANTSYHVNLDEANTLIRGKKFKIGVWEGFKQIRRNILKEYSSNIRKATINHFTSFIQMDSIKSWVEHVSGDERHCLSYTVAYPTRTTENENENKPQVKMYDILAINSFSGSSKEVVSSNIYFNNKDIREPAKFLYLSVLGLLFLHLVWIPQSIDVDIFEYSDVRKHVCCGDGILGSKCVYH